MAITKSSIIVETLAPGFNTQVAAGDPVPNPPVLDSMTVTLSFFVLDNDDSVIGDRVRKRFDIWPLLSGAQKTGMTNLVTIIAAAAQARA